MAALEVREAALLEREKASEAFAAEIERRAADMQKRGTADRPPTLRKPAPWVGLSSPGSLCLVLFRSYLGSASAAAR